MGHEELAKKLVQQWAKNASAHFSLQSVQTLVKINLTDHIIAPVLNAGWHKMTDSAQSFDFLSMGHEEVAKKRVQLWTENASAHVSY